MTVKRYIEPCNCSFCLSIDPSKTLTSEQFQEWLKAHPMDPVEQENADASVQRLKKRLREKPGPELNL